jgi:hypothetical protein
MISHSNKRKLDNADSEFNAKIQRVDEAALPQWLRVEKAVFLFPGLFGANVSMSLHWDEMSFDQFMAAGFITTYPDARQFRIEMLKSSPAQQFGFDGAVLINGKWSPVQVKDHRRPISPADVGSFVMALGYMKLTVPDVHAFIVSTSGFTERVSSGKILFNYDCITVNAAEILSRIPPAPVLKHSTDIDCMNSLRPCQQEALDAMESAFKRQLGYFVLGLPPGAGKMVEIVYKILNKGKPET